MRPTALSQVALAELRKNEFNLNIPCHMDTSEEEEDIDLATLQGEIDRLEEQLASTRTEMARYLKRVGFTN